MSHLLAVCFAPHEAYPLASLANGLGMPFDLLVLCSEVPQGHGAGSIFHAPFDEIPPADGLASAVALQAKAYSHVAGVSSMKSKDLLARVAGVLDASMVTDVLRAESDSVYIRPILAGSVLATVEVLHFPVVLTVRPAGFAHSPPAPDSAIMSINLDVVTRSRRTQEVARGGSRPDLTQAKVIVTGGRPLKDAATFELVIGELADALGGAVGATRAAVDAGIAPNELQVGQTGKIVAPDLYIAAGVSGSTQHMAGIKDSKLIVAINKDPDAPIFEVADLGLIADLFVALPELQAKLAP